MSSKLSVIKDGATRAYVGGELIYVDVAKTKQVKEIYAQKDGIRTLVWQYDINAPELIVNQDTSNVIYLLNSNSITISGTVSDTESGVASLTVNGKTMAISDSGSWSTTITVNYNARAVIPVVAIDNAGNEAIKNVTVYATQASSRPTTLYSYDNSMNVDGYTSQVSGSYTLPKGAKSVSSWIKSWTGDWPKNLSGNTSIVDKTTGQTLASNSYSYSSGGYESHSEERTASVNLTKEQAYEHTIVINYYARAWTSGTASGEGTWGFVHALAKGTASYY